MNTRSNEELNAVANYAIANNWYTRNEIITGIRTSGNDQLVACLSCCLDEGTLDTVIEFFVSNPHFYPEAQQLNNMHNQHVLLKRALMTVAFGGEDPNHLCDHIYGHPIVINNTPIFI